MEIEFDNGKTSLIQYLDQAVNTYCYNHRDAPECSCFNFPVTLSQQCQANSVCPPDINPSYPACSGKMFLRERGDYSQDGSNEPLIQINFGECIPFYCWVGACWENNQLKTSWMRDRQRKGCSNQVCINVSGVSTITTQSRWMPAAPAGAFVPSFALLRQCGRDFQPANPVVLDTVWNFAVDNVIDIPYVITNGGDEISFMTLVNSTTNWAGAPQQIDLVNQMQLFTVSINSQELLRLYTSATNKVALDVLPIIATSSYITQPQFTYTYNSLGQPQTFSFGITMNLYPPIGSQVQEEVKVPEIPSFIKITFVSLLAIFLFFLALSRIRYNPKN